MIHIGLDAGSTTVKVVAANEKGDIVYKEYRRHFADISGTAVGMLDRMRQKLGNVPAHLSVTGSAGMWARPHPGENRVPHRLTLRGILQDGRAEPTGA